MIVKFYLIESLYYLYGKILVTCIPSWKYGNNNYTEYDRRKVSTRV